MRTLPLSSAPLAVNALLYPARKITLFGKSAAWLSLCYVAGAACEGHEVVYVCGDNRFDPYAIARIARQRNQSRETALSRILIARAFTPYQLVELVQRLDPNRVSGPVIISGICSAFFDEDTPDNDAARLYYRTLSRLAELADKGLALLLTETQEIAGTRRAYFLTDLFRLYLSDLFPLCRLECVSDEWKNVMEIAAKNSAYDIDHTLPALSALKMRGEKMQPLNPPGDEGGRKPRRGDVS